MRALPKCVRDKLVVRTAMMCAAVATSTPGNAQTAPPQTPPHASPPSELPALPPAVVDNSLLIGGADIAAREVETRMTVSVQVAGRGPFRFVVDSGADTSALGSSTAKALNLPSTSQAMLLVMTASGIVDRVLAPELKVGDSTRSNLELPV